MSEAILVQTEGEKRNTPNEVVLVGKLRKEGDTTVILLVDPQGAPKPMNVVIDEVMAKFKFIKETNPSAAALAVDIFSGKFFQIQMSGFGGEMVTLPNGKKVRKSNRSSDPGYENIFESNRRITFNEIKEELLAKRVELVGGDPNNGFIRLTQYALMGFWDEFPLGFLHHVWRRNKQGVLEPFMSNKKLDDGTFKKEQAITNSGRHFIYEDELFNIEALRDKVRDQVRRWKIELPTDNTDPGGPDKGVKPTEVAPVTTIPEKSTVPEP
jgi:hypothetical protein